MCNMFKLKMWQNGHSNVIFLNCIYTPSQDTCDCIFMKCAAMDVAKFNVHMENAFRADHAPSRPVNHCIKAGVLFLSLVVECVCRSQSEGQQGSGNMDKSVPQLLREAAQAIERQSANATPIERPSSSMTPPDRSGGTRGKLREREETRGSVDGRQTVRPRVANFHSGSGL